MALWKYFSDFFNISLDFLYIVVYNLNVIYFVFYND
nr:MAG TPA: hypothetical protein [Caudoviricetes sp.]